MKVPTVCNTFNVGVTPTGVAITPNGKYAYVANNNNYGISGADSVTVLNLHSGFPKLTITDTSFNQPYTITIDKCGNRAYVSNSASTTVTIIDIGTNTVAGVINGFDGPSGVALTPNLAYVNNYGASGGVGSGNGTTVSVVNLQTNTIIATIIVGLAPAALVLSPCFQFLYVINYVNGNPGIGTLSVVSTRTNTVVATILGFSGPFQIVLSKCGNYAYVSNFGSNNFAPYGTGISVVDLKRYQIVQTITTGIQPAGLCLSTSGKYLYVTNYNTLYAGAEFTNLTPGQGTVSTICLENNKLVNGTIVVGNSPGNIAYFDDKLYVSNFSSNTVSEICLK